MAIEGHGRSAEEHEHPAGSRRQPAVLLPKGAPGEQPRGGRSGEAGRKRPARNRVADFEERAEFQGHAAGLRLGGRLPERSLPRLPRQQHAFDHVGQKDAAA